MKHTPGPWEVGQDTGYNDTGTIEQIGTGFVIASDIFGKDEGEAEANARLIARAPRMLEDIEGLLAILPECECDNTHEQNGTKCLICMARETVEELKG